jgi:hypothetical protein
MTGEIFHGVHGPSQPSTSKIAVAQSVSSAQRKAAVLSGVGMDLAVKQVRNDVGEPVGGRFVFRIQGLGSQFGLLVKTVFDVGFEHLRQGCPLHDAARLVVGDDVVFVELGEVALIERDRCW